MNEHTYWMERAMKEAEKALSEGEIPVGAVIVKGERLIGRGYNQVEKLKDPTAHAEMIAVTSAVATLEEKFLTDSTIYVTLEPCVMCAGALILSRIKNLVFGARDLKAGAFGSVYDINSDRKLNHHILVVSGILEEKCSLILKEFFSKLREKTKHNKKREG